MREQHSRTTRRIIAAALVLMMTAAPMTPVADVFHIGDTAIVVNAAQTKELELGVVYQNGDIISFNGKYLAQDAFNVVMTSGDDFQLNYNAYVPSNMASEGMAFHEFWLGGGGGGTTLFLLRCL